MLTEDDPFVRRLLTEWPVLVESQLRILVACSGGPDSVALVRALQAHPNLAPRLTVAHIHHGLRGAAADADQAFVEELSRQWSLPYVCRAIGPDEIEQQRPGQGWEAAARAVRYELLRDLAEAHACRYLVTGHTRDDQIETILQRFLRGTSLRGLAGMPAHRPLSPAVTLLRPLLNCPREAVLAFLTRLGQSSCLDATNASPDYTRNRIRHELLPMLTHHYHPAAQESISRLGEIAAEAQASLEWIAARELDRVLVAHTPHRAKLTCLPLAELPTHLRREVFVELWRRQAWPQGQITRNDWHELALTCESGLTGPRQTLPGPVRVLCEGPFMHLEYTPPRSATGSDSTAPSAELP